MSSLRDARLKRALESAPDAQLLPGEAARRAIRAAARQAVAPKGRPWWRFWEGGDASPRMPWNAALATVLLASLVTVLWHGQEVPPAQPDASRADRQAPAAPPAAATNAVPAAPVAPAPQPAPAAVAGPAKLAARPAEAKRQSPSAVRDEAPGVELASRALPRSRADSLAKEAAPAADVPAQAQAAEKSTAVAPPPPPPPPPSAVARPSLPALAAAAAPAPAPAVDAALPATQGMAIRREAFSAPGWNQLRLAARGRTVDVARDQAPRLAQAVDGLVARAVLPEPLAEPVTARIALSRAGLPMGVLEIAGPQVRWSPARGVDGARTARPDAAQMQLLEEEIEQLLR